MHNSYSHEWDLAKSISQNSARGLFITAEACASAVFVICSAFVTNSITKVSTPCHVVIAKPLASGFSPLLLQLRGSVKGNWKQFTLVHRIWDRDTRAFEWEYLFVQHFCSSGRWAFFLTFFSFVPVRKWEFMVLFCHLLFFSFYLFFSPHPFIIPFSRENCCISLFGKG